MENDINVERIIGDCFEINADIIQSSINSKLPRFIADTREKYYRNKLIKVVKKLKKANIPLNRSNLIEFFSYLYNNYSLYNTEDSKCKFIEWVKHLETDDLDIWEAKISDLCEYDNRTIKCIIKIDAKEEKMQLLIGIYSEETIDSYDIWCSKIETSNSELREYVRIINNMLIESIYEYIINSLEYYNSKEVMKGRIKYDKSI